MTTLVILVAPESGKDREPNRLHPHDFDTAVGLYGDLIEKTGANRILVLRTDSTDSMPVGIAELEQDGNWGLEGSRCVQIDEIDLSSWTGDEDPDEFWSGAVETTILNSGISSTDGEWCFKIDSGSSWNAFQLYALYEILGGSIWVTTERDGEHIATESSRRIPKEESGGEAALASMASFHVDNPGSVPDTSDLQGLVDGTPTGQGFENSLRGFEGYFEDEMAIREGDLGEAELALELEKDKLEEFRTDGDKEAAKETRKQIKLHERKVSDKRKALNDPKGYLLNPIGRYNANLALARKCSSKGSVKGGKKGIVIFVRHANYPEWLVEFLKEHRFGGFDKFAFIVGGINRTDIEQKSIQIHESAREHLDSERADSSRVVTSPDDVCFNIAPGQDVFEYSAEVTRILHGILKNNEGIDWSLEIAGPLAMLRPAVYQFAHVSKMPLLYVAREWGTEGSVHFTDATGDKHKLRIPNKDDVDSIRDSVAHENASRLIATAYKSHLNNPNSVIDTSHSKKNNVCPFYDLNKEQFPADHPLRYKQSSTADSQVHAVREGAKKAIELGSITKLETNQYAPNIRGIVAGALLVNLG